MTLPGVLVGVKAEHRRDDLVGLARDLLALEVPVGDRDVGAAAAAHHGREQVPDAVHRDDHRVVVPGAVVRRGHVAEVVVESQVDPPAREVAGVDREAVQVAIPQQLLTDPQARQLRRPRAQWR